MPIHKEGSGEQWGNHGKVYHGPDAKEKAGKQAAAAHANGYRGDEAGKAQCAGFLILCDNLMLLLHRTDRDEWEVPGGHIEDGETPKEAARREAIEEIGVDDSVEFWTINTDTTDTETVHYTTFIAEARTAFCVTLNHEHDDAKWFLRSELPNGTHPVVKSILSTVRSDSGDIAMSSQDTTITEMDIAKAIRDGKMESPQLIGPQAWLYDLRITGTGVSFRPAHDEYVFRPPEYYLCDAFLERCNGLPVIFNHPDAGLLNTEEYRNRSIGSIILPYIPTSDDENHSPTEVWGIARIYDADAEELMATSHVSTSPAVQFGECGTKSVRTDDGSKLLIEGNPQLLDHLAVTYLSDGVWDKGGAAKGVPQSA